LNDLEFSYLDADTDAAAALDAFVRSHPAASAYQLSAWCRAVADAYGYRSQILVARRDGRPVGMLPLCAVARPFGKPRWVSLPFCDLGGPLGEDAQVTAALAAQARRALGARKLASLELRCSAGPADDGGLEGRKVRMVLTLPDGAEALMTSYPPKLRSQIRKAEKNGLSAELSTAAEAVEAFYDVYAQNMRRLGSPAHSLDWFRAIHRHYGAAGMFVMLVRCEGKVVGAGWVLLCGAKAVIPWASTLAEYNRLAPNMLLYWAIQSRLCELGIREFDFGRSTFGEGTYKFKAQWGARPHPLAWQAWKAGAELPLAEAAAAPAGSLRPLIEKAWSKLPLRVANQLGPRLRRYITL
jgi:FemAB-related protein (PEP-CTERM system-associated)